MQIKNFKAILIVFFAFWLTGCSKENSNEYQGYAEGRYTYISANFSGKLEKLNVERGMQVKQNENLFILDQEPEKSTYDKALADLAQAKSAINQYQSAFILNKKNYERAQKLVKTGTMSAEDFDTAKSSYEQSEAQLKAEQQNVISLQAVLNQSAWQIQQKTLYAPKAAFVFDTYYLPGEWVPAGQPVLSLLAPSDIKVIFFVNEKTLSLLSLGQRISIACDSCQKTYSGKITYISSTAEYTPPVIYSDERRDKLVYRIEAFPENPTFFHPGMPVKISIVF
jgi:HlyD family secretion protein